MQSAQTIETRDATNLYTVLESLGPWTPRLQVNISKKVLRVEHCYRCRFHEYREILKKIHKRLASLDSIVWADCTNRK